MTHISYCRWGQKVNNNKCSVSFFIVLICPHLRTDASTSILVNIVGVECSLTVVQTSVSEDYENIYGRLTFCKKHLKQLFQGF